MKKLISVMIILCMLISISSTISVIAVGNTYKVEDDFSGDLSKWNIASLNADLTAEIASDTIATALSTGNKALKITCKTGVSQGNKGNLPLVGASSITSGKLVYQFDYYFPNDNAAAFTQIAVGGVTFYGSYLNYIIGGGITTSTNSLVKGKWNSVFVICDLTNDTLKVNVNGVNLISSTAYTASSIVPRIDFNWAEANDIVYFDNMKIYVPGDEFSFLESKVSGKTTSINPIVDLKFSSNAAPVDTSTFSGIVSGQNVSAQPTISNIYSILGGYALKFTNDLEAGKVYTVDLTNVKDMAGNSISNATKTFAFTTDNFNKKTIRNEDFDGYSLGNIVTNTTYNATTMPTKYISGTAYPVYVSSSTGASPIYSGTISTTSGVANVSSNIVSTVDNNSNPIQALQILNTTGANASNIIQFTSTTAETKTTNKKFVYSAKIRNGGSAGQSGQSGYTTKTASENSIPKLVFGYAVLNFTTNTLVLSGDSYAGGSGLNSESQYYANALPTNGTWFDFRYEVDMKNSNVSVYINDIFIGSRFYSAKYNDTINFLGDNMARWSFAWCYKSSSENAVYIDDINVSIQDVENKFDVITPLFYNNNTVVRGIRGGEFITKLNLVNNTNAQVNAQVIAVVKNSTGVITNVQIGDELNIQSLSNASSNLTLSVPVETYGSHALQLLVLKNTNTLTPIFKKYTLFSSGGNFEQ